MYAYTTLQLKIQPKFCVIFKPYVSEFKVPGSNKYLADSVDIKVDEPSRCWTEPKKIAENQFGEVFFKVS